MSGCYFGKCNIQLSRDVLAKNARTSTLMLDRHYHRHWKMTTWLMHYMRGTNERLKSNVGAVSFKTTVKSSGNQICSVVFEISVAATCVFFLASCRAAMSLDCDFQSKNCPVTGHFVYDVSVVLNDRYNGFVLNDGDKDVLAKTLSDLFFT